MNSATLAILMHGEPERVFDGTSTQVEAWMVYKWRAKII